MYTYQYNIYASMIQTLKELRQLNDWVIGFLDELSSQRPLADTLEGVQLQKLWYQVRGEGGEIVYEMCKLGEVIHKGVSRTLSVLCKKHLQKKLELRTSSNISQALRLLWVLPVPECC